MPDRKLKERTCKLKGCEGTYLQYNSIVNWCSPACGAKLAMGKLEKKEAKKKLLTKREHLAAKKEFRERDIPWLLKKLQADVNTWVRLVRDDGKPCISCGKPLAPGRHHDKETGHYKTRGAHGVLRFELENLAAQCHKCNHQLSGNTAGFRLGLIERIGLERVEWLEGPQPRAEWDAEKLMSERSRYRKMLKSAGITPP